MTQHETLLRGDDTVVAFRRAARARWTRRAAPVGWGDAADFLAVLSISLAGLAISAMVTALAPGAAAADALPGDDVPIAVSSPISPAASSGEASRRAAIPTVRALEVEDAAAGSESDPGGFDRKGLEAWWSRYSSKASVAAKE